MIEMIIETIKRFENTCLHHFCAEKSLNSSLLNPENDDGNISETFLIRKSVYTWTKKNIRIIFPK